MRLETSFQSSPSATTGHRAALKRATTWATLNTSSPALALTPLAEIENVFDGLRARHALFEILFPDLRPRPVEPVRNAVLNDGAGRYGLKPAVHVPKGLLALLPL